MAAYHYLLTCAASLLVLGCCLVGWKWWKKSKVRVYTEEERQEAARVKREMEELMSTPGWKTLVSIGLVHSNGRKNEVLLKPTENAYAQEYLKGEVNGIEFMLKIPEVALESADAVIKAAIAAQRDEE